MISPSIGRVVWYYPSNSEHGGFTRSSDPAEPCAALVAKVWGDRMVNLAVFDANGEPHSRTSVKLLQDDELPDFAGQSYATWMPYQVGQAKKNAT